MRFAPGSRSLRLLAMLWLFIGFGCSEPPVVSSTQKVWPLELGQRSLLVAESWLKSLDKDERALTAFDPVTTDPVWTLRITSKSGLSWGIAGRWVAVAQRFGQSISVYDGNDAKLVRTVPLDEMVNRICPQRSERELLLELPKPALFDPETGRQRPAASSCRNWLKHGLLDDIAVENAVTAGGISFVATRQKIVARDAKSGKELWNRSFGLFKDFVADDRYLYVIDGSVAILDGRTGERVSSGIPGTTPISGHWWK